MGGHSYILFISSYENVYKRTVLLRSCHRSDEWQVKLVKKLTKIT